MIAPISLEEDVGHWDFWKGNQILEIRKRYDRSGLYLNDDSVEPRWTVAWYSKGAEFASDGVHLTGADGTTIVLDLTTGEIVTESQPPQVVLWTVTALSTILVLGCITLLVFGRRMAFCPDSGE